MQVVVDENENNQPLEQFLFFVDNPKTQITITIVKITCARAILIFLC